MRKSVAPISEVLIQSMSPPARGDNMSLTMTVNVTYDLNGASQDGLADSLFNAISHASQEGALTGSSDAEVHTLQVTVDELSTDPLVGQDVAKFIAMISRLETDDEMHETGDGMSGDDAASTLSCLISEARVLRDRMSPPTMMHSSAETKMNTFSEGSRFIRSDMVGRLLVEKATSLDDAELHRVFDNAALPVYCIEHTQRCRDLGLTLDEVQALNDLGNDRRYLVTFFETGNAAFGDGNKLYEAAAVMQRAAEHLHGRVSVSVPGRPEQTVKAQPHNSHPIHDTNGNRVGYVAVLASVPEFMRADGMPEQSIGFVRDLSLCDGDEAARAAALESISAVAKALEDGRADVPGLLVAGPASLVSEQGVNMAKALDSGRVFRVEESYDLPSTEQFCYAVTIDEFEPGYGASRGEVHIVDGLGAFVDGFENTHEVRADSLTEIKSSERQLLAAAATGDETAIAQVKATWPSEDDELGM